MKPNATDWHGVALAKLTHVMGERAGPELAVSVLRELGLEKLRSAEDLRRFASMLSSKGGFAAAVGGLLGVHAAMYEASAAAQHD